MIVRARYLGDHPRLQRGIDEAVRALLSLLLVGLVTIGLVILDHFHPLRHVSIIYLIPVVIAATKLSISAAVVAALAGAGCSAFFFYPPIYDFRIHDPQQLIDLPLFVLVAVVTGHLATLLKHQAEIARRREQETRDFYAFSRKLAVAYTAKDIYAAIEDHLSSILQRRVILIQTAAPLNGNDSSSVGPALPAPVHSAARELVAAGAPASARMVAADDGTAWLVRVVSPKNPDFGVIAIDLGAGSERDIDAVRVRVDAMLWDAAATLERLDVGRAISEARMRAETDLLREALIGSVSHELRTPLSAILGAASVLGQTPAVAADRQLAPLAQTVRDEAERLNNDIQNLLDATRISSDGVRPNIEWTDPADVINAAVERKRRRLSAHRVKIEMRDDLPLVQVDPLLIEQSLGQIIENAAKYSPSGSLIRIEAGECDRQIAIAVSDQGVGLDPDERSKLWERFYRSPRHQRTVTGSGLGLWIANAFVVASGGRLEATSAGAGCGATITMYLPAPPDSLAAGMEGADE